GVALSTPSVFKARSAGFSAPAPLMVAPANTAALAAALAQRANDLTAPAIALAPMIGDVLHAIDVTPACLLSRMSGSGATCFGLFEDEQAACAAAAQLASAHPSWWLASAPLVSRP
ncbi:MAG TPA: 4-(cytidine 5'-diphospho)-2-C-methyl-D-erythritol kinase, partial [Patescibacteria group bacterium]|nr:4-(cytidine 5'-diphospho)-2-C-methyl-D-erythritol kinase [Patescibacteria group bacterium]